MKRLLTCLSILPIVVACSKPTSIYDRLEPYERVDVDEQSAFCFKNVLSSYPSASNKGTVVTHEYQTHSYALESLEENKGKEITLTKSIYVYLPYGYSENEKYNVTYLYHGTAGSDSYWLKNQRETTMVLDSLVENNMIEKTIIVCPSYYSIPDDYPEYQGNVDMMYGDPHADLWIEYVLTELKNDIIPLVSSLYSTYLEGDVTDDSLTLSRNHRALAGLSRGAFLTTYNGAMNGLDYFSYFGNYSGAGKTYEEVKTKLDEYDSRLDIKYWYFGTGTADTVGEVDIAKGVTDLYNGLLTDARFKEGENIYLVNKEKGTHYYGCWLVDLYNSLQVFFK